MNSYGGQGSFLQAPLTERVFAFVIDVAIVGGLCLFPVIGWIFGLLYFLLRDALPYLNGQSFGKKLMKIQVISLQEEESLMGSYEKSALRAIVMLIPILNLIDIWFLFSTNYRLADRWAQTAVVPYSDDSESDNWGNTI